MARDHVEIEVKLGVDDPEAVLGAIQSPPAAGLAGFDAEGEARLTRSVDRYVDTADGDGRLKAAGLRARLRVEDGEVILGLKGELSRSRDRHERREIEGAATEALDPAAWPPSTARDLLLEGTGGERLVEIARLRQERVKRVFVRGSTRVEVSLDRIEALDGEIVLEVRHEIEAELLEGDPEDLDDLAAALRSIPGVGDHRGSKLAFAREAVRAARAAAAVTAVSAPTPSSQGR